MFLYSGDFSENTLGGIVKFAQILFFLKDLSSLSSVVILMLKLINSVKEVTQGYRKIIANIL